MDYGEQSPIRLEDVAKKIGYGQSYLEQIIAELKVGNIVNGKRGPKGGTFRVKKLDEISVYDLAIYLNIEQDNHLKPILNIMKDIKISLFDKTKAKNENKQS